MNKREIAIVAGLVALSSGCSRTEYEKARGKAITKQMIGDPSREIQNFRWGGTKQDPWHHKESPRELPSKMQSTGGRER